MTKLDDITARSHLIGKWIRAQRHAMKSLSCLAVVGLDQTLQMQVQDTLSGMVNHIEVSVQQFFAMAGCSVTVAGT